MLTAWFTFAHHADITFLAHPICILGKFGHHSGCLWYLSRG